MSNEAIETCRGHLEQLIRTGVQSASGLKEALNEEREALERQDADTLNNTAVNKRLFLSRLEELDAERRKLCIASGFSPDPEDMEELVKWCDSESVLFRHWKDFVDLARECSELNMNNGAIINIRRQQITGALSAIRGDSGENETYDRTGRDNSGSVKRVLAEI